MPNGYHCCRKSQCMGEGHHDTGCVYNLHKLKAGRETDLLIAEIITGKKSIGPGAPRWSGKSTDALEVWDAMIERDWQCSLVHKPFEAQPEDRWVFHGTRLNTPDPPDIKTQRIIHFSAHADTRALAIARGALASRCAEDKCGT